MRIEDLGEPELEFGQGKRGTDPRRALALHGPFDSTFESATKSIRLGLVALPGEVDLVRRWFARMHQPIVNNESNARRFREFPGVENAFRCRFDIPDRFVRKLEQRRYDLISARL